MTGLAVAGNCRAETTVLVGIADDLRFTES